tara:strand:- start:282 stop:479 length:198 start_codon:yes stop_codon:yes gene_type:complete
MPPPSPPQPDTIKEGDNCDDHKDNETKCKIKKCEKNEQKLKKCKKQCKKKNLKKHCKKTCCVVVS